MNRMRRGTIYKNLWVGNETYFILERELPESPYREPEAFGYRLAFYGDKWNLSSATMDKSSLCDSKRCPIVGYVDVDEILINGFLKEIGREHD